MLYRCAYPTIDAGNDFSSHLPYRRPAGYVIVSIIAATLLKHLVEKPTRKLIMASTSALQLLSRCVLGSGWTA